jgi:hypothetical protein
MADNRTFILIGRFQDNITPELKKLNRTIDATVKNFTRLESVMRPVAKNMESMAITSVKLSSSFSTQSDNLNKATASLRAYRTELQRTNSEQRRADSRGGRSGGGRGGGTNFGALAGSAVAGNIIGTTVGNVLTQSVVSGFEIGSNLIKKALNYGANAIKERIEDEMSDIQSAGGMFSADRRNKSGVFKSLDDAIEFQESLNARLAKSASSLPGATSQYVQQAKMLTDTMILSYGKNVEAFNQLGATMGAKSGKDSLAAVLQKFTEKSVLLGMGSGGSGGMGVPQILEMLVSQEKVNLNSFRQFSAYMSNPLLKGALEAAQKDLQKTGANTADRLKVIMKVLDDAVPNEVVQRYKNTASGIIEAARSGFMDPETGLFGLGRKLDVMVPKVNAFGEYLDKSGKVVRKASMAAREQSSVFSLLRQGLGGFVLPLTELIDLLPQIYDPLKNIAQSLVRFRDIAQSFYRAFNVYTAGFEDLKVPDARKRGSLLAIADLLVDYGAIAEQDFNAIRDMLKNPKANLAEIAKNLFKKLFSSKFMNELGRTFGGLIGSVVSSIGTMMKGLAGAGAGGGIMGGIIQGFQEAGGVQGFKDIFTTIFGFLGDRIKEFVQSLTPEQMGVGALIASIFAGIPQGLLGGGLTMLFNTLGQLTSVFGQLLWAAWPVIAAFAAVGLAATLLGGSFDNFGLQLQEVWAEVSSAFSGVFDALTDLGKMLWDLVKPIWDLIPGTEGLVGGFDALKSVLFPVVATFQLMEVGLKALVVTIQNIALGFARFLQFLSNMPSIKGTPIGGALSGLVSGMNISEMEKKLAESQADVRETLKRHNDYYKNWDAHSRKTEDTGKTAEGTQTSMLSTLKGSWKTATSQSGVLENLKKLLEQVVNKLALMIPAGAASAAGAGGSLSGEVPYKDIINEMAAKYKIPANILAGLIKTESNFNPNAVSSAGAFGLTQLMPGTASEVGVKNIRDPRQQIEGGAKYLAKMKSQFGDWPSALRAYNQGPGNQQRFPGGVSSEAVNYPGKVLANAKNYSMTPGGGMSGGRGMSGMQIAGSLGNYIKQTGGAPGSIHEHPWHGGVKYTHAENSYHKSGRAIDIGAYANEQAGVISRIKAFNSKMGVRPVEFLHAGNDSKHQDHVHVAYAFGAGMPAFFNSQRAAVNWERSMMPAGASVRSVTSNTSEGLGGAMVTAPITINAGSGQNAKEIAAEVIFELNRAVTEVRAASLYG